ncbi:DUF1659 domain-containing protein [Clostridium sardiniense]|uniref:DUF1659 domain-containing protein n=1 Tax=Clostridium sardiniense TaxID=29369 RepID=UPI00195614A1|nr:DUF1659 domain-containing protein [Clostridium sardiniense]MBM7833213.1 hypothetical protein [Clostridium sardiniense]
MITKTIDEVVLKITYNKGKDDKGKDIIKYQRFKDINLNAKDEDLHAVGVALSEVVNYPAVSVEREEASLLSE